MARLKDRERALELRKQNLSYSQIKEILGVSKGTLSVWLRDYPLSRDRINELRARSEKRIELFRMAMQRKRKERLLNVYNLHKRQLLPLSRKEIFVAGLFLYLGEGGKTKRFEASLSNTDPVIIRFFIFWLTRICGASKEKLKIRLHLYSDMDAKKEIRHWSGILGLDEKHFKTPYIKKSSKERINYRGVFGHGTCNVIVGGVNLFEKIMMSIKVITDNILGA